MRILIICSKRFYNRISNIKEELERYGHEIELPNCYDEPDTENKYKNLGEEEHRKFKARMFKRSEGIIENVDAVLVLNHDKEEGDSIQKNYIGGATFLEMYDAFRFNKKIYLFNNIPEGILKDEISGFNPIILNGNLKILDEI